MTYLYKKGIMTFGIFTTMGVLLAGCGVANGAGKSENSTEQEVSADQSSESMTNYQSDDGWAMSYDEKLFSVSENKDGEVDFVYQGACSGTDMVAVTYVKNVMPQDERAEVLQKENTEAQDMSDEEGYFGKDHLWAYTCEFDTTDDSAALNDDYYFMEHNGGTIVIESITHTESEEENAEKISDAISELLDTFTITDGTKQTEYSDITGTYQLTNKDNDADYVGTIVLNDDHTGLMQIQDDVNLVWTSSELIVGEDEDIYEYTIEGDYMYVQGPDEDGWTEYIKQ